MVLSESERKARRKAGIEAMTEMEKIAHAISSGRPPASELKTPGEAIQAAKALYWDLHVRLKPYDNLRAGVAIAYVTADLTMAFTVPCRLEIDESQRAQFTNDSEIRQLLSGNIPLGLIYILEDASAPPEKQTMAGVKPFLVTKLVVGWLSELVANAGPPN